MDETHIVMLLLISGESPTFTAFIIVFPIHGLTTFSRAPD